jgi:hypothetical protein
VADDFCRREPCQLERRPVDRQDDAVAGQHADEHEHAVEDGLQPLVRVPRHPFRVVARGDVLHDRGNAPDGAVGCADRVIAGQPDMRHARVGAGLAGHLEVDGRLAGLQHRAEHRFDHGRDLGDHLPERAADMLLEQATVDGREPIVDANVAQIPVEQRQADGRAALERLELRVLLLQRAHEGRHVTVRPT